MKKIGEGWQYAVYDIGNGRVLKKFHSWLRAYWVIFKTIFPFKNDSFWIIPSYINSMKSKALDSFKVIERKNIPSQWIGNPKLLNDLDFEQDKAEPLHEVLDKISTEEGRGVINKFIEFNKRLFNSGVIDKGFNITKNYGLSSNGDIVLIDIGELFDDPERIKNQREMRVWAKYYVADFIKNLEIRDYFISEMDKSFGL